MTQHSIEVEARAFTVWRYAEPRDWSVGLDEIAQATGLLRQQVAYVIRAKGWGGRVKNARVISGAHGTDVIKGRHRKGDSVDVNRLDVLQLMGES